LTHKSRIAYLMGILVAVLAVGCGSQSSTPTASQGTSTTRSPLVAQADPICQQIAAERQATNAALRHADTSTTKLLQALAQKASGTAAYERRQLTRLSKLSVPSSIAHDWGELLAGMRQLAGFAERLGPEARSMNAAGVQKLVGESARLRQRLASIAGRDGFTYCGRAT
jgi:hypothetical protein